jgi:spore maturation protein CgeB
VLFLERDTEWYASNRDDRAPAGCRVELYGSVAELRRRFREEVAAADAAIVGSYVPEGVEVLRWVLDTARGLRLFYDIDTPITLAQLAEGRETYLTPESVRELDGYLSFTGGPLLGRLEREFGAQVALPLYCSVDPEAYAPEQQAPQRDLGYLGTYSADRQPTLDRLLTEPARAWPEGRFVVAGPCYPELDWPRNVERIEHVAPGQHRAFYGSLRFTLNVTRRDMIESGYSPSVRLFEAAACAVPIVSDVWSGIEEFFEPGSEIVLATSSEQVLELLRGVRDEERRAIGERARARVLRQHTALHRAKQLEGYVLELRAGRLGAGRAAASAGPRSRRAEGRAAEVPAKAVDS